MVDVQRWDQTGPAGCTGSCRPPLSCTALPAVGCVGSAGMACMRDSLGRVASRPLAPLPRPVAGDRWAFLSFGTGWKEGETALGTPSRCWVPLCFVAGAHVDAHGDVANQPLLQHTSQRLNVKCTGKRRFVSMQHVRRRPPTATLTACIRRQTSFDRSATSLPSCASGPDLPCVPGGSPSRGESCRWTC